MSDNIDVTPGVGKTVATDEVTIDGALVQVQRIKPTFGTPGSAVDVSPSNPLPVVQTGALSVGQSGSWSVSVTGTAAVTQSGTWNVNNISGTISLPTGASTVASQGVPSAVPYAGTGDGTEISIAKGIYGLLATPATQLPKTPLLNPSDLTYVFNSSSATTTRSLVSAVASQTTRSYRMVVTAAGATTLSFTDGSGGATLYTFEFPSAGAFVLDLDSRAYFATSANTALHVISSAAVKTTVALYYLTSV